MLTGKSNAATRCVMAEEYLKYIVEQIHSMVQGYVFGWLLSVPDT